jgi:Circadian oscillating protein COP23
MVIKGDRQPASFSGICYFARVEFLNLLSHNLPVGRHLETGFFAESLGECEVLSKKPRFLTSRAQVLSRSCRLSKLYRGFSTVSNNGNFFNVANLTVGVLGLFAAVGGVAIAYAQGWSPLVFGKDARFSCQNQPDTQRGGEVWTVMYRQDKGQQPWLKMVTTLGGDYTPLRRCEIIAERLNGYRKDGLTKLSYRGDPNTPKQYVICAKTKLSGDSCPLLVTLKPGSDTEAYNAMRDMTESLQKGTPVYRSGGGVRLSSRSSPEIDLTPFLAEEDRLAGANSAK